MTIEDELRRLMADDRLDVPVKPDAVAEVVRGARRRRRHRRAAATSLACAAVVAGALWGLEVVTTPLRGSGAVASATVVSTLPPPTGSDVGYGPVRFDMTSAEVEATGAVKLVAMARYCAEYRWADEPDTGRRSVTVSRWKGVVQIVLPPAARTPEGVGVGSAEADVPAAYPGAVPAAPPTGVASGFVGSAVYSVGRTGEPGWEYVFGIADGRVAWVLMRKLTDDCLGRLQ
ncbi:hypothetical protein [Saccharothrix sp. Mg75]|uniref:hypothetical protein n=1 Tax=Saccharothrix sp. Mg75 TaxID=3445357 RepID=UPI003EEE45E9